MVSVFGLGLKDLLSIGSLAVDVYSNVQQTRYAEKAADLQKAELRRQQDVAAARARQEARIKQAQLLAAQGRSGAMTSTATQGAIGIGVSLDTGLSDLNKQVSLQTQQFDLQASNVRNQAFTDTLTSMGVFAASGTMGNLDFGGQQSKEDILAANSASFINRDNR